MEGPKKREHKAEGEALVSGSVEQIKKKRTDESDQVTQNLPILPVETTNIENNSGTQTDEEKDLKKLEQETCHLTDMNNFFPDLVWKEVMSKIGNKSDIEDCSNASPYFRNFLEEKRHRELVHPKVFSIMAKRYEDNTSDESYKETNLKSIPWRRPPNKRYINPMTNFWKCRLVCKAWNQAIQNIHDGEETGHFGMKMDFKKEANGNLETWGVESFETYSGAVEFLAHFDPTHFDTLTNQPKKNPFLGKCVVLNYQQNYDGSNLHPSFMEMLRRYGEEIRYFSLIYFHSPGEDQEEDVNGIVELYNDLRNFVQLCPKLRVFRFLAKHDIDEPLYIQSVFEASPEQLFALNQLIAENPLPKFFNLEFLATGNLPTPIFNELINQNRADLRQMEIGKDFHQNYNIFGEGELPYLKKLSLDFSSVEDFEKFENCPFNFELEKFHLWYHQTSEFIPWSRIFQALENKLERESCTELILQLPLPRNEIEKELVLKDTLEWRLKFPRLERISIFEEAPFCLDFLLPAKKTLEKIRIRYNNNGGDWAVYYQHLEEYGDFGERQSIKYLGYKEKINESNVFQEFLNLDELTILKSPMTDGCVSFELEGTKLAVKRLIGWQFYEMSRGLVHKNWQFYEMSRGLLHKNYKPTVTITGHTSFKEACGVTLVILTIVSLYFFYAIGPR